MFLGGHHNHTYFQVEFRKCVNNGNRINKAKGILKGISDMGFIFFSLCFYKNAFIFYQKKFIMKLICQNH